MESGDMEGGDVHKGQVLLCFLLGFLPFPVVSEVGYIQVNPVADSHSS